MSTSNSPARTYHHGDLRRALLDAALALVERERAEDISLREVARRVGVSAAAVYRHFPDKQALMEAIASEGLERLGAAQQGAAGAEEEFERAFSATGIAYVCFALENPGLFRLIFTYPGLATLDPTRDHAASILQAQAREIAQGNETAARLVAVRAWSLVHGLAMLIIDGRLPADAAMIEQTIRGTGMMPQPPC